MELLLLKLIPVLVPVIVALIKKLPTVIPTPLIPVVAFAVSGAITSVSAATGIHLPTELASYDQGTVTALLTNTTVLTALGVFVREVYDQAKKWYIKWTTKV